MEMKRTGVWDEDFGRVPTGQVLPLEQVGRVEGCGAAGALARGGGRQPRVPAAVHRQPRREVVARRDRGLRERDRAVPQPVAVPARARPRPTTSSRPASGRCSASSWQRPRLRRARAAGGLRVLPGQRRRRRADRLGVRGRDAELCRYRFPRQRQDPFLCISDFSAPGTVAPARSTAAFHIVTMGGAVSEETARLFADNRFLGYLLLHGLGVEMAEALAEYWHHRIRTEWVSWTRTVPPWAGCSASSTAAAATRGAIPPA